MSEGAVPPVENDPAAIARDHARLKELFAEITLLIAADLCRVDNPGASLQRRRMTTFEYDRWAERLEQAFDEAFQIWNRRQGPALLKHMRKLEQDADLVALQIIPVLAEEPARARGKAERPRTQRQEKQRQRAPRQKSDPVVAAAERAARRAAEVSAVTSGVYTKVLGASRRVSLKRAELPYEIRVVSAGAPTLGRR